uniref:Uncharacterized protein n=1 Tax=Biomphalaria glabrata TaxID=6526 RepID=A0A2C9LFC4_BIOGL
MDPVSVLRGHDPGTSDNSSPVTASTEEVPELIPIMESGYSSSGANNPDVSEYLDEDQRHQTLLISISNIHQLSNNQLESQNDELFSNLDSGLISTVREGNIESAQRDESEIQAVYSNLLEILAERDDTLMEPVIQHDEESLPLDTNVPDLTDVPVQELFQSSRDITVEPQSSRDITDEPPTMESGRIMQETNNTEDDQDVHSCAKDVRVAFYFLQGVNINDPQRVGDLNLLHRLHRLGRLPLVDCISCLLLRVAVQNLPCGCCCSCLLCAHRRMFCAQCQSRIQDSRPLD